MTGDAGRDLVHVAVDTRAVLGEGPAWDEEAQVLWWVDILPGVVHRFDPATGEDLSYALGRPVGAVVPRRGGGLALAMEHEVATFDPASRRLETIVAIEPGVPGNRVNDAKCDARGRFWVGTMAYDWRTRPGGGALYRVEPDGSVERVLDRVTLSNGLAWSLDQRVMYHIDSGAQRIDGYAFDLETGTLTDRRTVVEIPPEAGLPDGLTIDAEGYLWLALAFGSAVWRIDPADGRVDRVVRLPVSQVTSCAFGGPDLSDLYVTTGGEALTAEGRAAEPQAGTLFRLRPGVSGLPAQRFAG